MTKHTPGPWLAFIKGNTIAVGTSTKGKNVDKVVHWSGFDASHCEVDEQAANAKAIAAVPDFMEAAAMMTAAEDSGGDMWWRGFEMLKAAYKKAGGQFPSMDQS